MAETDDLHAAARRQRDREAARGAPVSAKEVAARSRNEQKVRRAMVREALAEAGGKGKALSVVALCVGLFVPLVVGLMFVGGDSFVLIMVVALGSLVCAFASMHYFESLMAALRRRRLYRIGRGFEPGRYLEELASKRRYGVVVVRMEFTQPWPDDARDATSYAVADWMKAVEGVAWDRDVLVLRSGRVKGIEWLSGGQHTGGGHNFNNCLYHGWFVRIVDYVLPHLERVAPIATISATIEGAVEPWDADADA